MTKQITKKQHYIPQFLLRNFANEIGPIYRINVYDIQRNTTRLNQNIADVCAQNWFYDKDNIVEDILSHKVEAPAAIEISKLLAEPQKIENSHSIEILRFILALMSRTPEALEQALDFINSQMKTIFKEIARLNKINEAEAEKLNLIFKEPRNFLSDIVIDAISNWLLIIDLAAFLIINHTDLDFIISDHPIFQYNWYLRNSNKLSATSLTKKGLQIFFPLSPKITYCLYDNHIYKYGNSKANYIIVERYQDIVIINSYQALNAASFLLYRSENMSSQIIQLGKKYRDIRTFSSKADYIPAKKIDDNHLKSIHKVWRVQRPIREMPSFIKIKSKVRKKVAICEDRNPEAMKAHTCYKEWLEK